MSCNHTLFADYKQNLYKFIQSTETSKQSIIDKLHAWEKRSCNFIQYCQLSDASLLYQPIEIAIASILCTEDQDDFFVYRLDTYLLQRFGENTKQILLMNIQSIEYLEKSMINPLDPEIVKKYNSKLKKEKKWPSDKSKKRALEE